jgi:hypothetical protein
MTNLDNKVLYLKDYYGMVSQVEVLKIDEATESISIKHNGEVKDFSFYAFGKSLFFNRSDTNLKQEELIKEEAYKDFIKNKDLINNLPNNQYKEDFDDIILESTDNQAIKPSVVIGKILLSGDKTISEKLLSEKNFIKRKLLILAKTKHKIQGYKVIALDTVSNTLIRLAGEDNDKLLPFGCVSEKSNILKYNFKQEIEVEILGPIILSNKAYFYYNENSINLVKSYELEHVKFELSNSSVTNSVNLFYKVASENIKELYLAYNGLMVFHLTGSKLLKHFKLENTMQLRLFDTKLTNYMPIIKDKDFITINDIGKKFVGYIIVEFDKNQNIYSNFNMSVQGLIGHKSESEKAEKLHKKHIENDEKFIAVYTDYDEEQEKKMDEKLREYERLMNIEMEDTYKTVYIYNPDSDDYIYDDENGQEMHCSEDFSLEEDYYDDFDDDYAQNDFCEMEFESKENVQDNETDENEEKYNFKNIIMDDPFNIDNIKSIPIIDLKFEWPANKVLLLDEAIELI